MIYVCNCSGLTLPNTVLLYRCLLFRASRHSLADSRAVIPDNTHIGLCFPMISHIQTAKGHVQRNALLRLGLESRFKMETISWYWYETVNHFSCLFQITLFKLHKSKRTKLAFNIIQSKLLPKFSYLYLIVFESLHDNNTSDSFHFLIKQDVWSL